MTINAHEYFLPRIGTDGHKLYLPTITYKHYCADELKSTDITELRLLLLSRSVFTLNTNFHQLPVNYHKYIPELLHL